MRHGNTVNKLGRTASHRNSMMSNMATSLILQKRITTTLAKAKALRKYVEPMITKAKEDTTHSRRTVFSYLQSKDAVKELFGPVAEKVGSRPGGYTRILKTMNRKGDNAEMAIMELVDFNEAMLAEKSAKSGKKTTRRGRKPATAKPAKDAADTTETTPTAE